MSSQRPTCPLCDSDTLSDTRCAGRRRGKTPEAETKARAKAREKGHMWGGARFEGPRRRLTQKDLLKHGCPARRRLQLHRDVVRSRRGAVRSKRAPRSSSSTQQQRRVSGYQSGTGFGPIRHGVSRASAKRTLCPSHCSGAAPGRPLAGPGRLAPGRMLGAGWRRGRVACPRGLSSSAPSSDQLAWLHGCPVPFALVGLPVAPHAASARRRRLHARGTCP